LGQFAAVLIVVAFVGVASGAVWLLLKETMGLRVTTDAEEDGVDASELVLDN
jgi:Amt family ammonium transporter